MTVSAEQGGRGAGGPGRGDRRKPTEGRRNCLPAEKEREGAKGDSGGLVAARLPLMLRNPVGKRQQERETGGRKQRLMRERSRGVSGRKTGHSASSPGDM